MAQWVVYRVIVQFGNRKVAEAIQWSWRINYLAVSTSPQSRTPWVGHEAEWEMKSQRWRARENRKLFFANMSHSDSVFMHVQTKPLWGLCIFRPSICPADLLAHPPHSGTTFACGGSCHWLPAVSRMCHLLNHPTQWAAAIKIVFPYSKLHSRLPHQSLLCTDETDRDLSFWSVKYSRCAFLWPEVLTWPHLPMRGFYAYNLSVTMVL